MSTPVQFQLIRNYVERAKNGETDTKYYTVNNLDDLLVQLYHLEQEFKNLQTLPSQEQSTSPDKEYVKRLEEMVNTLSQRVIDLQK